MKIWVDDMRPTPDGYNFWFKSVNDVVDFFECMTKNEQIELISLDHDAGDYYNEGGDYIRVLDWMIELGIKCPVELHTMNPVGRDRMRKLMQRYGIEEYKR